jgi:hypothetical protein
LLADDHTERYKLPNGSDRIEATVYVFRDSQKLLAHLLAHTPNEQDQADFIKNGEWRIPKRQMRVLVEANSTPWHFTAADMHYDPDHHCLTIQAEIKPDEAPNNRVFSFCTEKTDQALVVNPIFGVPNLSAAHAPSLGSPPVR